MPERQSYLSPLRILPVLIAAALFLASCDRGGEVIPRRDFARIHAEIFLLDEQLSSEPGYRRMADTSRVYEAVLEKYGYTVEDFICSERYYLEDAGRYVRMLKKSVAILEERNKALKKEKILIDKERRAAEDLLRYAPNRIYLLFGTKRDSFSADELLEFDFQKGLDTAYRGPEMIVWADTLRTAFIRDSLRRDSLRLDSLRRDSLKRRPGSPLKRDAGTSSKPVPKKKSEGRPSGSTVKKGMSRFEDSVKQFGAME